jgi:hypothetical protein
VVPDRTAIVACCQVLKPPPISLRTRLPQEETCLTTSGPMAKCTWYCIHRSPLCDPNHWSHCRISIVWSRNNGCQVLRSCIMSATSKTCCARSQSGGAESSSMHGLTCGLSEAGIRSQRRYVLCTLHTYHEPCQAYAQIPLVLALQRQSRVLRT